jgi:hypothetical protein
LPQRSRSIASTAEAVSSPAALAEGGADACDGNGAEEAWFGAARGRQFVNAAGTNPSPTIIIRAEAVLIPGS